MLRPARMVKVALVGLRKNSQTILSVLYDLGAMQVEPVSQDTSKLLRKEGGGATLKEVSEELLRIRALKSALPAVRVDKKRRFVSLNELLEACRKINIDEEVKSLRRRLEEVETKIDNTAQLAQLAAKLSFLGMDLSNLSLRSASSYVGEMDRDVFEQLVAELRSSVGTYLETHTEKEGKVTVVLVVPSEKLSALGAAVQKLGLRLEKVPQLRGTPQQVLEEAAKTQKQLEEEAQKIRAQLLQISQKHYADIVSVEEQLVIEARKLEMFENLGFTESVIVIEGWVPEKSLGKLRAALERNTGGTTLVFTYEPSGEKPPTLMENPKPFRPFEAFVRFYSLPQAEEVDPTVIYSLVFPVFFGLMIGDVGYGALILLLALWIKRYTDRPGRTIVPKSIRSFAKTFFRPSGWAKLSRALIPGSILAIVFGVLFNEYFGFHLNQHLLLALGCRSELCRSGALLDPVTSYGLKKLLLLSGYIGLGMVTVGFVLGMVDAYWEKNPRHMLGKLGWLAAVWGIALLGLALLHQKPISPLINPAAAAYIGLIVGGIVLVVFGEGTQSLVEIPSLISHVLSYTRLVGILLSSVILAEVINTVFLGTVGGGVGSLVGGALILVFGQAFNLLLAMFEPGIQGARLLYVEFFSKFYRGNGRMFRPFGGKRTYTEKQVEIPEA